MNIIILILILLVILNQYTINNNLKTITENQKKIAEELVNLIKNND